MNPFAGAFGWLTDPASWRGAEGIAHRLYEHVHICSIAIIVAAAIAIPLGMYIGHRRRFEFLVVSVANLGRALPSFGILAFVFPFTLRYLPGIGFWPTLIALFLLAIPPILTNVYVGIKGVDPDIVESARGVGMNEFQVLRKLETPLAAPGIVAGLRTSAVAVVATATLGAVVAWGGLGRYIIDGLARRDSGLVVGGAILVAGLAILTELLFGLINRLVSPAGGRRRAPKISSA
ncbi:MAG: ABC transporter permease [Actinomycetota bacterium]